MKMEHNKERAWYIDDVLSFFVKWMITKGWDGYEKTDEIFSSINWF